MSNNATKASLALELKIARDQCRRNHARAETLAKRVKELESEMFLAGVRAIQTYLELKAKQEPTP